MTKINPVAPVYRSGSFIESFLKFYEPDEPEEDEDEDDVEDWHRELKSDLESNLL